VHLIDRHPKPFIICLRHDAIETPASFGLILSVASLMLAGVVFALLCGEQFGQAGEIVAGHRESENARRHVRCSAACLGERADSLARLR
jgi:hypothetical protein